MNNLQTDINIRLKYGIIEATVNYGVGGGHDL